MERIKKLLGKRIKELRDKCDLSQQELSEITDINQKNLSKIECGVVFPSKCLDRLANALDIKICELFEFEHLELSLEEKKKLINAIVEDLDEDKINLMFKMVKSF